jgi:cytochrome c peroxidase
MLRYIVIFLFVSIVVSGIIGCLSTKTKTVNYGLYELPVNFPVFENSEGNELTELRIELGRKLFYDPVMSRDSTISCSSCHKQQFAFADNLSTSPGIKNRAGIQNVPSLGNIAYATSFTRAGGVPTLEMQILVPVQEHNEFDFNLKLIAEKVALSPLYDSLSQLAYNRKPDPFVVTRSIAAFERTLLSCNSAYDLYTWSGIKNAMSKSAKRGMKLFLSEKTNCSKCHKPPHFSDFSFKNNGIYEVYSDSGRMRLTLKEEDRALFKVASLRNVAITSPYMHDGSIKTLEEVINHYNNGGSEHFNKDSMIHPLNLSEAEKKDLIAFLNSLSDTSFIHNPAFGSPY